MKSNVAEFVEEIRDVECVDELRDAFSNSVSSLGFDSFFYGRLHTTLMLHSGSERKFLRRANLLLIANLSSLQ